MLGFISQKVHVARDDYIALIHESEEMFTTAVGGDCTQECESLLEVIEVLRSMLEADLKVPVEDLRAHRGKRLSDDEREQILMVLWECIEEFADTRLGIEQLMRVCGRLDQLAHGPSCRTRC